MMGLWADGWFYISSAGLLVSGVLFFFLLGQYRVASEAADATEGEKGADKEAVAPDTIRPVYIPEEAPAAQIVSHSDAPGVKADPKPRAESESAGFERRKDSANTTGGISPAVVYLQNIKGELADLHKDLRALATRVDDELVAVSTRDEALIERLGELTRAVESMKAAAMAETAKPEPAPKKARKAEKIPEPLPEPEAVPVPEPVAEPVPEPVAELVAEAESMPEPVPEPAPMVFELELPPAVAPAPEPVISADETIRMDLSTLIAATTSLPEPQTPVTEPEPEPAPVLQEPAPEVKPRRGPVWPV